MSFVKTLNKMGYCAVELDTITESFVQFCQKQGGRFLDIGSGFGLATIPVANAKRYITTCDMDPRHLQIIRNKIDQANLPYVTFEPRKLGKDLTFPDDTFDGILIAMVLHFFTPDQIPAIITSIHRWLKPGGRLFVSVSSPHQRTLLPFLPVYQDRKKDKHPAPGIIEDVGQIIPKRAKDLPKFNNIFDLEDLSKIIQKHNFALKTAQYFTRDNLPTDIALDGREYVGIIAEKLA